MMRQIALLLSLAVSVAAFGQEPADQEEKAANAILKLGGKVTRDEKLPGRPVVAVELSNTKATDSDLRDLKELKGLKDLRVLYLGGTNITDAGLKGLKELKDLQCLGLNGTHITDAGLKDLKELKGLRDLGLGGTKITEAGLMDLKQVLPNTRVFGPGSAFTD